MTERLSPPPGLRTTPAASVGATRVVLVRHGEAQCNVGGVVGGELGCTGLTDRGIAQVEALRDRLAATAELAGCAAVYSSVLSRAVETAEILVPALDMWRDGPPLRIELDCDLCELHPGQADGLTWQEFSDRFGDPNWAQDPDRLIAPGGESWSSFVDRASFGVERIAQSHQGELVVLVCHAGVIESTLLRFLPLEKGARLMLRTGHASLTEWVRQEGRWTLGRYNDIVRGDVSKDKRGSGEQPGSFSKQPSVP